MHPLSRIAIAMQKGGVGKTETTVNLADALAEAGHHVVVFDLDPQGSLTKVLRLPAPRVTLTEALVARVDEASFDTADLFVVSEHNVSLKGSVTYVPRTPDAFGAADVLVSKRGKEHRLARLLDKIEAQYPGQFGYALIDCPPNLGVFTDSAIIAARRGTGPRSGVLVPIMAEQYAVDGLPLLVEQIAALEQVFGLDIDVHGLLIGRYNWTKGTAVVQLYRSLCGLAGLPVLQTLPERTKLFQEAERVHTTAFMHAPDSDLADGFRAVARYIDGAAA